MISGWPSWEQTLTGLVSVLFLIWYQAWPFIFWRPHIFSTSIQVKISSPFKKTTYSVEPFCSKSLFGGLLASLFPINDCLQKCWPWISEWNGSNLFCRFKRWISRFAHPSVQKTAAAPLFMGQISLLKGCCRLLAPWEVSGSFTQLPMHVVVRDSLLLRTTMPVTLPYLKSLPGEYWAAFCFTLSNSLWLQAPP